MLLTARTFFSEKDPKTPAILGIITIGLFYVLALTLSGLFGFEGIPMSNSIVAWLFLIISLIILHVRYQSKASLFSTVGMTAPVKMLIAGILEAVVLVVYTKLIGEVHGTLSLIAYLAGAMVIGAGVYLGALKILKSEDLSATLHHLLRKH
jgi:putative peptidoglycan lipid II flippase